MIRIVLACVAIALCVAVLASCTPKPDTDLDNNVYPAECPKGAPLDPASFVALDPVILESMTERFNSRALGLWLPGFNGGLPTVFYDETAKGWEKDDILRHEDCHGKRARLTGDPRWHPVVK